MSEGQHDSVAVLHGVITISRGESSQTIILSRLDKVKLSNIYLSSNGGAMLALYFADF